MPKVVDHDARRQQVAEAMWEVVHHHGLEGASIRRVAEQAGMSIGLVQHYFSSKDEMEQFAFEQMIAAAQERMRERVEAMSAPPTTRTVLRMILIDLTIPADERRLAEYQVVLSFSLRALRSPRLAQELQNNDATLFDFIVGELQHAQQRGDVPVTLDPEAEATMLLCFADGCGQRILLGHLDAHQGAEALDRMLGRLFIDSADTNSGDQVRPCRDHVSSSPIFAEET